MQDYIIYKVNHGDTKQSIAKQLGITPTSILCKDNPNPGDRVVINTNLSKIHIVKPGDTLDTIASYYQVDKQVLKQKNNITRLFVGQQLFI